MTEKVTIMVLKVDLDCSCVYKKIKKLLCEFHQIRNQVYDEKQNTVTITVMGCNPEKIRDKLCCKGRKIIKCIQIKEHDKKPENKVEEPENKVPDEKAIENKTQKPPAVDKKTQTEDQTNPEPATPPQLVVVMGYPRDPIGLCCGPCSGGPCYHGPPPPPCYPPRRPCYCYGRPCYITTCHCYTVYRS